MRASLSELADFAKKFAHELPETLSNKAHIVGLRGNLGAGKTTFAKLVAKELGVTATVHSPTFTLVQAYPIDKPPFKKLVHVDAYRLSPDDADTIGWAKYSADPHNIILVEWPENLPGGFSGAFPVIEFSVVDEETRELAHYGST